MEKVEMPSAQFLANLKELQGFLQPPASSRLPGSLVEILYPLLHRSLTSLKLAKDKRGVCWDKEVIVWPLLRTQSGEVISDCDWVLRDSKSLVVLICEFQESNDPNKPGTLGVKVAQWTDDFLDREGIANKLKDAKGLPLSDLPEVPLTMGESRYIAELNQWHNNRFSSLFLQEQDYIQSSEKQFAAPAALRSSQRATGGGGAIGYGGNDPRDNQYAELRIKNVETDLNVLEQIRSAPPKTDEEAAQTEKLFEVSHHPASGQPYVSFFGIDRVGLAFSGGGIRSATFNLGILQGLHHHNLLPHVDYLSTVSGGGYIGAWWRCWKHRHGGSQEFPEIKDRDNRNSPGSERGDSEEVRHLREFSNLLIPRLGLFNSDLWYGIVAILGGMVPSLLMGASLILTIGCLWLILIYLFNCNYLIVRVSSMLAVTLVLQLGFEIWWRKTEGHTLEREETELSNRIGMWMRIVTCLVAPVVFSFVFLFLHPIDETCASMNGDASTKARWSLAATGKNSGDWPHHLAYVLPQLAAWGAAAFAVLVCQRAGSAKVLASAASARVVGRLLTLLACWLTLTAAWEIALYLDRLSNWVASALATSATLTAIMQVRSFVTEKPTDAKTPGIGDRIKSALPRILSYLALFLFVVLLFRLVIGGFQLGSGFVGSMSTLGEISVVLLMGLGAFGVLFLLVAITQPEKLGLHSYYHGRLVRAYLGASNSVAGRFRRRRSMVYESWDNVCEKKALECVRRGKPCNEVRMPCQRVDSATDDDVALDELNPKDKDAVTVRPIHLICATANDLNGDHLANIGRGSYSAVFSPFGLSIGDRFQDVQPMTVGKAITAAAAAFNSQMGSVSRQTFGPAVTFLLASFNLRLGIWRSFGPKTRDRHLPGALLFREFISGSTCPEIRERAKDIHFSDGGHFENLGLYELVRRHCRFIIVTDCGADTEYKFDDLGNAIRRIREDFGIDIAIDTSPLVPDPKTGLSRQHMVVGTIQYDDKGDQGLLFLFKPTMTGDEPSDVTQYKTRNAGFPQETTADQLYDEAQWESYRKLGEHAARAAFRFCERTQRPSSRYSVFNDAYWEWYPTPAGLQDQMLEQTARFVAFTEKCASDQYAAIVSKVFSDVDGLDKVDSPSRRELMLLIQSIQMMEDAFVGLQLGENYSHPLNSGWLNLFNRWTQTEALRKNWVYIEPLFSRPFAEFLHSHCGMRDYSAGSANLENHFRFVEFGAFKGVNSLPGDAVVSEGIRRWLRERESRRANAPTKHTDEQLGVIEFLVNGEAVQIGSIIWRVKPLNGKESEVQWDISDYATSPFLRGVGISVNAFPVVEEALKKKKDVTRFVVTPDPDRQRTDAGSRAASGGRLRSYSSLGFRLVKRGNESLLVKDFKPPERVGPAAENAADPKQD